MAFIGSIVGVDLDRWTKLIASHPHLAPIPSREGVNPFTTAPFTYRAPPGDAHVVVAGTHVGAMTWAQDGTNQIAVDGDAALVEPVATNVASKLGGIYQRGG